MVITHANDGTFSLWKGKIDFLLPNKLEESIGHQLGGPKRIQEKRLYHPSILARNHE